MARKNPSRVEFGVYLLWRPISCRKVGAAQVHFIPHRLESGCYSRQIGRMYANAMLTGRGRLKKPGRSNVSNQQAEHSGGSCASDKGKLFETTRTTDALWYGLNLPIYEYLPSADSYWQKQVIAFFAAADSRREQLAGGLQPAGIFFKL
jgi:hypothetical protein